METRDNFTHITGIGPAIERRLHEAGITTFADLAVQSATQLANVLQGMAGMSASRIEEQKWIERAGELASNANVETEPPPTSGTEDDADTKSGEMIPDVESPGNGQHYATFKLDLLLESDNEVRRTRIVHVQDGEQRSWAGWQPEELLQFIAQETGIKPQAAEPPRVESPEPEVSTAEEQPMLTGALELRTFEILRSGAEARSGQHLLRHHETFTIHMELDIRELSLPEGKSLQYSGLLRAKQLRDGTRIVAGRAGGEITDRDRLVLRIPNVSLQPGAYRLEAEVTLSTAQAALLSANVPGRIVQVS